MKLINILYDFSQRSIAWLLDMIHLLILQFMFLTIILYTQIYNMSIRASLIIFYFPPNLFSFSRENEKT